MTRLTIIIAALVLVSTTAGARNWDAYQCGKHEIYTEALKWANERDKKTGEVSYVYIGPHQYWYLIQGDNSDSEKWKKLRPPPSRDLRYKREVLYYRGQKCIREEN